MSITRTKKLPVALLVMLIGCTQRNPAFIPVTPTPGGPDAHDPGPIHDPGPAHDPGPTIDPFDAAAAPEDAATTPEAATPAPEVTPAADAPDAAPADAVAQTLPGCPGQAPRAGWSCIAPGTFSMGSPNNEAGHESGEVAHPTTITQAFLLKTTEVTQAEWRSLMDDDPSNHTACDNCPVEEITWYEAIAYANALSTSEGLVACYHTAAGLVYDRAAANGKQTPRWTGQLACVGYRLPTEAEWEYAARAGSATAFHTGAITNTGCTPLVTALDSTGWYCGNAKNGTRPVALKPANAWGLFDMHGNVWEWVWDWQGNYPASATDPSGPASGSDRINRGGSYYNDAKDCRAAVRSGETPDSDFPDTGFRLAKSVP